MAFVREPTRFPECQETFPEDSGERQCVCSRTLVAEDRGDAAETRLVSKKQMVSGPGIGLEGMYGQSP